MEIQISHMDGCSSCYYDALSRYINKQLSSEGNRTSLDKLGARELYHIILNYIRHNKPERYNVGFLELLVKIEENGIPFSLRDKFDKLKVEAKNYSRKITNDDNFPIFLGFIDHIYETERDNCTISISYGSRIRLLMYAFEQLVRNK